MTTFDAASTAPAAANVTRSSLSWSHTCTGSDRYLLVGVGHRQFIPSAPSATYNGISMTLLQDTITDSADVSLFVFGLAAPATGANTIAVSWTTNTWASACGISFNDNAATLDTAQTLLGGTGGDRDIVFTGTTGLAACFITHRDETVTEIIDAAGDLTTEHASVESGRTANPPNGGQTAVATGTTSASFDCNYDLSSNVASAMWVNNVEALAAPPGGTAFIVPGIIRPQHVAQRRI